MKNDTNQRPAGNTDRQPYRADIDGLRAVAVLAVVCFHAAPTLAPGGFVGVDIFFVISGFLITGIIIREIDFGSYGTLRFYERRLRRIAPAFLMVGAFSAAVAALLYTPDHFELFGESLIASILIHANIFFFHESGYFAASDEVMPLLHVWSLSVEEQFYVLFPIGLVLLTRWRNLRVAGIVTGIILSFVAACVAVTTNPDGAFYLAPYRAWELLLGSLLAIKALPKVEGRIADVCSWAGGVLIVISIWGLSRSSVFPGYTAALPCFGAALVIHAGPLAKLNRGLSIRPMVGVGLISYSLYLWHWPLLSFGAYIAIRPLSPTESATAVGLSFLAAYLSYRYVEQPFRRPKRRLGLAPVFTGVAALLAVAFIADATKGASWRLPVAVARMVHGETLRIGVPDENCITPEIAQADPRIAPLVAAPEGHVCRLGDPAALPTVVLWGDSHARSVAPALDDVLAKAGLAGYLLSRVGCPPVTGLDRIDPSNLQCAHFADAALETIVSIKPAVILLAARWAFYFEGTRYGAEEGPNALFSPEGNVAIVASRLDATLAILGQLAPQLVLVESVPEIGVDVSSTLARAAILGRHIDIAPLRFAYEARQDKSAGAINSLAKKHGAVVIRPEHYLCDEVRCAVERGGRVLYRDYDHLSQAGAALLIPMFAEILSPSSGE